MPAGQRPRPAAPVTSRGGVPGGRLAQPQARPVVAQTAAPTAATPKTGGGWKIILQFVIGLIVIAAVAATIVWLYYKYYAQ
jgi:hypothetical protein